MKAYLNIFLSVFIGLTLIFIPVTWNIFPFHSEITSFVFGSLIKHIAIVTNTEMILFDFSSDSKGLYFLVSFAIILSIVITPFLLRFVKIIHLEKFKSVITIIATYYLAIILLKYGFDKVFKAQFYLPEPNILYTPFGKLDKDILFWSTMGTSYSYNLFMGFMEIIPAILILFKRTRQIGLLVSLGVLINVFAINLSFDISVKLFSGFLIILNLYLLIPTLKTMWNLFVLKKESIFIEQMDFSIAKSTEIILKSILICILILESLFPYLNSGNFNDDFAKRPFLHGAYEVQEFTENGKKLDCYSTQLKRIFIHRDGYIIFQNQQDEMTDYKLDINQIKNSFILTDYGLNKIKMNYTYSKKDSLLIICYNTNGVTTTLKTKTINWQKLPALQKQFHWMVD
ncbi:MAG: hypothetical protein RI883_330 [Bacteroidota bacterium]|jgi:hypothetical protein